MPLMTNGLGSLYDFLDSLDRVSRRFTTAYLNPIHPQLMPEPGHLAFRELARANFHEFDCLSQIAIPFEVFDHLPIAQRLHRNLIPRKATFQKSLRFIN